MDNNLIVRLQRLSIYTPDFIEECRAWFPQQQTERIATLKGSRLMEAVAGYNLLVETLRETGLLKDPPLLEYAENGKPFLKNYSDLHFNISHCRTHIALALSHSPVGIDVESLRRVSPSLIKRVCSDEEQHIISQSSDPDMEFLRLWTRKEAYLKYTGTGIVEPLTNIPPQSTAHCPLTTKHRSQVTGYIIETHPLPEDDGWVSVCWEAEIVT